jgi:hypothetical protein
MQQRGSDDGSRAQDTPGLEPVVRAQVKPGPGPADVQLKTPPDAAMPSALAMEWKAFDAPQAQRFVLYLQAGDRYEREDDLASAVRCYAQAVRTAAPEALQIEPNDSWLLVALKRDQIKQRKEN